MIIKNGMVFCEDFCFHSKEIAVEGTLFSEHFSSHDAMYDASDCYVIPGLTDLHFHGCIGHDFSDGTTLALKEIASYELKHGITTICPATMTLPIPTLLDICKTASDFSNEHTITQASLVGIDLEGPFLSEGKKGAQDPQYMRNMTGDLLQLLQHAANGLIKIVAVAPEEEHALSTIAALKDYFSFSLAHTMADYDTAMKAFSLGANHVTHLYNAMLPFSHRAPGVVGAAFDSKDVTVELICDGIHIHPSVIRSTFQLFGDDRIILISDSTRATGMPDGSYLLGGQETTLKGNLVTLRDHTIAGSATNLFDCMKNAVSMGIPLESAIKAATANPAKSLGIFDRYGSITVGKTANFIILSKSNLSIQAVFKDGVQVV